jgi:putative transposase
MPWTESRIMDARLKFVSEVLEGSYSMTDLCEAYGISRKTGYKWFWRYESQGPAGLHDRSRAPHHHPNGLADAVKSAILSIKVRFGHWGPAKIHARLQTEHPRWSHYPAVSTIGEYLKRQGLVRQRKRRRRGSPTEGILTAGSSSNDLWCADFKGHFQVGNGRQCNPLTISDHVSRYLLCCRHVDRMDYKWTRMHFERVFREYGLPLVIRTDNGSPFSSRGLCGLTRLSYWWIRLGIHPERIEPGHPEQNGRHERMHRTLKAETANPPARDLRRQQQCFDAFVQEFNHVRPHEALGQNKPGLVYTPSPREYREPAEVWYPDEMEVRSVKGNGVIHWRGDSVFLGEALGRQRVGLSEVADGCWVVYFCRQTLGVVDQRRRKVYDVAEALRKGSITESAIRRPFR